VQVYTGIAARRPKETTTNPCPDEAAIQMVWELRRTETADSENLTEEPKWSGGEGTNGVPCVSVNGAHGEHAWGRSGLSLNLNPRRSNTASNAFSTLSIRLIGA